MTKKRKKNDATAPVEVQEPQSNKIRHYRLQKKMSQAKLANAVGTTEPELQRWESGAPLKINVAFAVSKALDVSLADVFPGSKSAWETIAKTGDLVQAWYTEGVEDTLLRSGIEIDPRAWCARMLLRGQQIKVYPTTVQDAHRAFSVMQDNVDDLRMAPSYAEFFRFSSTDREVAVNLDHLVFWQNCWDVPAPNSFETEESEDVKVYIAGMPEPLRFHVNSDEGPEGEDDEGQFRQLMVVLEGTMEKTDHLAFQDIDGEWAFIKVEDIAIIEVARSVMYPEPLEDNFFEDDEEGESTASQGDTANSEQAMN